MNKTATRASMPPYFSWVLDDLLALSGIPYDHEKVRYITENNIHTVVSITTDRTPPFFSKPFLKVVNFRVHGDQPPSLNDCRSFAALMDRAKSRREVNFKF